LGIITLSTNLQDYGRKKSRTNPAFSTERAL